GYLDVAPLDKCENTRREICLSLEEMGINPQYSAHKYGPGQNEIDFKCSEPVTAADNMVHYKTVVKTIAAQNGLYASFMPKPLSGTYGSALTIVITVRRHGQNIFEMKDGVMCAQGRSFIAGILHHIPEMTTFLNPIINSYTRLRHTSFELKEDEIEIGIGIHGEPGTHREKISSVNDIADTLLGKILAEGIYHEGDEVAVMVNGMGGTPLMELFVANKHVKEVLAGKGIKIYKTLVGNYMTSLDMEGFSITLLKLDEELKKYLDAPADTPAFVQA
ncbi:MAG: dihydroxyacetone kinase subunit DhaK, partial [Erysipelotrichales bacterium]|nr:dihydroxyacetone kinase subunit DhaK [Erysipelotrichales bacterium]